MKVLVADESLTVQKQINVALASPDCEVIAAADGQDALQKIKTLRPDVVLADCALRYLDGFDLIEKVRADSSLLQIRAILLKGQVPKGKERRLKEVRADEVLSKPLDQKILMRVIQQVLSDEGSTAIQPEPEILDEDQTPIVRVEKSHPQGKVEKIQALNSKLTAIAQEVVGSRSDSASVSSRESKEVTAKVHPKDFQRPVQIDPLRIEAPTTVEQKAHADVESIAREEVRKWISENMPRIVEKLIKDELAQFTKGSR